MHSDPDSHLAVTPNLLLDGHVHTRLCNHATGEMEEYVQAAISRGLKTLIFLEHLETGITTAAERIWLTAEDFDFYFREGARLKEKYQGQLTIKLGVEMGFNPQQIPEIQALLKKYPWDHRGLSYHFLFNGHCHLNMVSKRRDNIEALAALGVDAVLNAYFSGLQQGLTELEVDVLCHLDAVLRHYPDLSFQEHHWEQIEQLLDLLARTATALEINTSGFPLRGTPYPEPFILRRAREKNITFIAGSDAHQPEQVGRFFTELPQLFSTEIPL